MAPPSALSITIMEGACYLRSDIISCRLRVTTTWRCVCGISHHLVPYPSNFPFSSHLPPCFSCSMQFLIPDPPPATPFHTPYTHVFTHDVVVLPAACGGSCDIPSTVTISTAIFYLFSSIIRRPSWCCYVSAVVLRHDGGLTPTAHTHPFPPHTTRCTAPPRVCDDVEGGGRRRGW